MKNFTIISLSAVAIIGMGMSASYADKPANFTSHHLVDKEPYAEKVKKLPAADKLKVHEYLDYEQREPCQFYQPIPKGFMKQGCHVVPKPAPAPVVVVEPEPAPAPIIQPKVLAKYHVLFGFDSASIEPDASSILDRVAREITTHNPSEVTVAGYADRSGASDYNVKLSERRAHAVSETLNALGVENRVIGEQAYGETNLEVETPDGVRNAENRRVEIRFMK